MQTQVLPYLREIQKDGIAIHLLTFERDRLTQEEISEKRKKLAQEGITWHFLKYHKRPSVPATFFDILCGAFYIFRLIRRERLDVLHARVHVPALMAAIAKKLSFGNKPKILFDIRGFFPEEYVDAGVWKEGGWLFRSAKSIERWLFRESDGFVVLTEKARNILFPESRETGFDKQGRPVEVIPCCVDLNGSHSTVELSGEVQKERLGLMGRFVIAYVGSFGGWYMTDEMVDFFGAARKSDQTVFAMVITQNNPKIISELLENRGFGKGDYFVKKLPPKEVASYLNAADIAISFIKPCYSKLSSSPTKIAEYLSSGLPVISTDRIGDVADLLHDNHIGAVINGFEEKDYIIALEDIKKLGDRADVKKRCRQTAHDEFDLVSVGGKKYQRIYENILK